MRVIPSLVWFRSIIAGTYREDSPIKSEEP